MGKVYCLQKCSAGTNPEKYQKDWLAQTIATNSCNCHTYTHTRLYYDSHAGPKTASGLHLDNQSRVGNEQKIYCFVRRGQYCVHTFMCEEKRLVF